MDKEVSGLVKEGVRDSKDLGSRSARLYSLWKSTRILSLRRIYFEISIKNIFGEGGAVEFRTLGADLVSLDIIV